MFKSGVSVHSIEPGGFKTAVTNLERLKRSFRDSYCNASSELQEVYGGNIGKESKDIVYKGSLDNLRKIK